MAESSVGAEQSQARHHSKSDSAISQHADDVKTKSANHVASSDSDVIDLTADDSDDSSVGGGFVQHGQLCDSRAISQELGQPLSDSIVNRSTEDTVQPVQVHHVDVKITSRAGLHTMLEEMGKNHGFRSNVVNSVYKESNGLKETDDILRIMREAAQDSGEREIRGRAKGKKTKRL